MGGTIGGFGTVLVAADELGSMVLHQSLGWLIGTFTRELPAASWAMSSSEVQQKTKEVILRIGLLQKCGVR